jgi:ATP adenylyltransferase
MPAVMEHLWAPWRMEYIGGEPPPGCIFCDRPRLGDDREALIVARRERAFAILNKYPYNNGHVMVCPYRHVDTLEKLDGPERLALVDLCAEVLGVLRDAMRPDGFNIGANIGRVAGAGVEGHVHLHVVPRWSGDTNFMPVVGLAKVVSQHLEDTFDALAPKFAVRAP